MRSFGDRFRETAVLKDAEGIETLSGTDLANGSEVVIKVAPARELTSALKARLEHELDALAQLRDPRLPASIHLRVDDEDEDGLLVVVREQLAGPSLEERLVERALDVRETVTLAIRVLSALTAAHASGVLHRDIKPSNVVLVDGSPDRATLVDFGLARHSRLGEMSEEYALRAARYLSPEQLGILRGGIDVRSDLYSVGATLHEALTRRPAFAGSTVGETLRAHLTTRPAGLRRLVPSVPSALERVIERLLRKDPRDRYQTAAGALADFEDLAAALDRGVEEPETIVGSKDVRHALTEPAFIDRTALGPLETARAAAHAGDGELVVLEGESGGGKTWVLDELGRRAAPLGAWVLRGRGVDQAAQAPFQLLTGVVAEIVIAARSDPALRSTITRRLGIHFDAACAALPELRSFAPEVSPHSMGREAHGERRTLVALTALLDALGSAEQPAIVLLDDAQWADEPTLHLLEQWHADRPRRRYTTVIVAVRPDAVRGAHALHELRPNRRLRLTPFAEEEVRQQVASMAGMLPEEVVQIVLRNAAGNPFFVSAMLHGLVEIGALVSGPSSWQVVPDALEEVPAPPSSNPTSRILSLSLTKVDDAARELLTLGAVLGRTFDPVFAGGLIGVAPAEAMRLVEACRGNLVWAESAEGSFTFIHDKVREELLARLSDDERRRLHLLAAERLERDEPSRVFELAYHFDAAGEPVRAFEHALAAAENARARFALDLAERHYRIAHRGATSAPLETRWRVAKGLGEVLTIRSHYEEAQGFFEEALEHARAPRESAEVEERWASLEMKRGDMRAACAHGEAALRLMGRRVPASKLGCVVWSIWELLVQVLHVYLPRIFVGRRELEGAEDELFVIRIFHGLNGPYFFSKGVEWAGWAHLRLINLAERYPPCLELGRAYAAHAVCLNGFPALFERGLRISKAGAELCERLGDPWGQAQGLTFHAMMLHYVGRFAESCEVGTKASELFDRTGDRWEGNSGLDFAVDSLYRMGDLKGAVQLARRIWQRGHEIGDSHALAWSLDAWSRATDGRGVPPELLAAERAREDHFVQTALALEQAEGVRLLGKGRPREAELVLEAARVRNMKEAGFFYDLNAPILVYAVAACRMQAEAALPWAPGERARLLHKARAAAKRALPIARKFRNNLAHALRESALVAAMEGDDARAQVELDRSVAIATELEQRYERALSREARGRLGEALGWKDAAAERLDAEGELRGIRGPLAPELGAPEAAPTLSLADRFITIVQAGRALATALSASAVHVELERAALTLLRAERCVILELRGDDDDAEIAPVHGSVGLPVHSALVRRATAERSAIAGSGAELDPEVRAAAIRSVLCVPIVVRGAACCCLYVVHSEVEGLFGDEELRIGDYLGTLAGAALENAHGFAQIQSLSRELEARVEERTAQLARTNAELEENLRRLRDTQEQLVQAGKMAAVGTLVAGLSHELNNPLGIILGYVHSLLQQLPTDSAPHKPLTAIERQARRCIALVRALLDFSRTKPSVRERVHLAALCDNVLQLVAGTIKTRDLALKTALPTEAIELVVCPQEIETALLNLLSNAVDASPVGATVELGVTASTSEERAGVEFSVRDEGPGIPEAILSRVFDPFFTTKPVGRGTGLGLSLARRIVESHEGRINVATVEGAGTTMTMWLPIARSSEDAP